MPGSRAAGLGQDHQRFLHDHDERARARPAGQAARDAAIMDSNPRSDLRILVRLFPGYDGQSDDRVLQQPRNRPARHLPADFCRGYRGPEIAHSIEALEQAADWRVRNGARGTHRAYSITSSAVASSDCGMVRPSAVAVLRLIISSYLVGACTGMSAGFSPLRMRSTYPAARRTGSSVLGPYVTRPPSTA